ncbi:hypothetical protein, partial [Burkholderia thailandensis]|uniref:hypothetical protein n=1 Tax=Burkholderia thailandensis TaxID=57975 RepID=UPI0018E0BE9F
MENGKRRAPWLGARRFGRRRRIGDALDQYFLRERAFFAAGFDAAPFLRAARASFTAALGALAAFLRRAAPSADGSARTR